MYEILTTAKCIGFLDCGKSKEVFLAVLCKYFTVMGSCVHVFDNGAFTIAIILGESHAILHTYPERQSVYMNICSCTDKYDQTKLFFIAEELCSVLDTSIIDSRIIKRY